MSEKKDYAKRLVLNEREICDLELLVTGGFHPLTGYLSEEDFNSVLSDCRLKNGSVWPIPINLCVSEDEKVAVGDLVALCDEENTVLAGLKVTDCFAVPLERECLAVVGTTDRNHPYVQTAQYRKGKLYLGGPVERVCLENWHHDFEDIRRVPAATKEIAKKHPALVGFQTRNPLHRCHVALIEYALEKAGENSHCLLHPVVGVTQAGDINKYTRVRCYRKALKHFPKDRVTLSTVPLAMRMAGPREAVWHAIVRRNYGCTHFVIGRDHAGPSSRHSETGEPFYGPFEAHALTTKFSEELGIKIILCPEIVFASNRNAYILRTQVTGDDKIERLSGSEVRKRLMTGEHIPGWFSFPEVVEELRTQYINRKKGLCVYFIGLSGAGKSTLTKALASRLREAGRRVTVLDGDIVRRELSRGLGFSKADRSVNVRRIGFVASTVVEHGGICICANIAPYKEDREFNRSRISAVGRYVEVFVSTPLEECERRDTKGLYRLARQGVIKQFTGVSDPFEEPDAEDAYCLSTADKTVHDCVNGLVKHLKSMGIM